MTDQLIADALALHSVVHRLTFGTADRIFLDGEPIPQQGDEYELIEYLRKVKAP